MQSLTDFAFLPGLHERLDKLAAMAIPEPWRYPNRDWECGNPTTHILERHLYMTFEELMRRREYAADKDNYVYIGESRVVFNTGLMTRLYQDIYAYMTLNRTPELGRKWVLLGFLTDTAYAFDGIVNLPKPLRWYPDAAFGFHPDWPIRLNLSHMILSEENLNRLPESIRSADSLPQTIAACADRSMKMARYTPSVIVPQWYDSRLQYLLPLFVNGDDRAEVALTLDERNGYYVANTALTLEMAYGNARLLARPEANWLRRAVEQY